MMNGGWRTDGPCEMLIGALRERLVAAGWCRCWRGVFSRALQRAFKTVETVLKGALNGR